MMLAFYITDGCSDEDFREKCIVYHVSEDAAKEMGRWELSSQPSFSETVAERAIALDQRAAIMTEPEVEEESEFLRAQGWGYEDERSCDSCGLRAYGMKQYGVCRVSGQCKECGCGEPRDHESPCEHEEGFSCE